MDSVSVPFFGLQTTVKFSEDEVPLNYRQKVLELYPNGSTKLLGVLSVLNGDKPRSNPEFNYYTYKLTARGGTITNVYTTPDLGTAYVSGGVAGDVLYVKMGATEAVGYANIYQFRKSQTVKLQATTDYDFMLVGVIMENPTINGSSSYIKIKLLEADDNSSNADASDANLCYVIGTAHGEGGMPPQALNEVKVKATNKMQIFKDVWKASGTSLETLLRTDEPLVAEKRRKTLQKHMISIEDTLLDGVPYEDTDPESGEIRRFAAGLNYWLRTYASNNLFNYTTDTDYSGLSWLEGGEDWLDACFAQLWLYGDEPERLCLTDNLGMIAVNKLVKNAAIFQFSTNTTAYGLSMTLWKTPFGDVHFATHPRFNLMVGWQRTAIVINPKHIIYTYLMKDKSRDTSRSDVTPAGFDGYMEQFLTECSFEFHYPDLAGKLVGLGLPSAV